MKNADWVSFIRGQLDRQMLIKFGFLWKITDLTEDKHLRNRFDKREHYVLSI